MFRFYSVQAKKVRIHRFIEFFIDSNALASIVLEEIWTDNVGGLKSTPNIDFDGIHWMLLDLMWINIVPNSTILFVNILIHSDIGLLMKVAVHI